MTRVVLGLGTNLGARRAILLGAELALAAQPGLQIVSRSRLYETPPLGPPQPDYLNAALLVDWVGSTESLMAVTRHVELLLGRERRERWGARTIDLDLLWSSEGTSDTHALRVPHPELEQRDFALAPLLDVAPELRSQYEARLSALGGAPKLAAPGWPDTMSKGAALEVANLADEAELSSLLASAVLQCGRGAYRPTSALPFRMPLAEPLAFGDALVKAASRLAPQGFHACFACVTSASETSWSGVFLGEHAISKGVPSLRRAELRREGGVTIALVDVGHVA